MPAITPQFMFDFESRMQAITENEYARFGANLWWSKIANRRPTGARREIIAWLLSTARIEKLDGKRGGGSMRFDDIVSTYTEFEAEPAGAGLQLEKAQLEDTDGNGLEIGAKWAGDIGAYMSYWPQKQTVKLLKEGHLSTSLGYDAQIFFSAAHPVNPFNTGAGTFQNIFTGAASGSYPGACPIDESVSLDVAIVNLAKMFAYIKSIKMPNGDDPRFLKPTQLVVPPRLQQRAVQLTSAKFIAQAAVTGGGSADVEALIRSFGFVEPIVADELSGFESDTTFFLATQEMSSSQLGGIVYVDRLPFSITYYTGEGGGTGVDAILRRADLLEWQCKGRNVAGYGHPYTLFKCKGS
jgi:phage major head subunit gpT-like protein